MLLLSSFRSVMFSYADPSYNYRMCINVTLLITDSYVTVDRQNQATYHTPLAQSCSLLHTNIGHCSQLTYQWYADMHSWEPWTKLCGMITTLSIYISLQIYLNKAYFTKVYDCTVFQNE